MCACVCVFSYSSHYQSVIFNPHSPCDGNDRTVLSRVRPAERLRRVLLNFRTDRNTRTLIPDGLKSITGKGGIERLVVSASNASMHTRAFTRMHIYHMCIAVFTDLFFKFAAFNHPSQSRCITIKCDFFFTALARCFDADLDVGCLRLQTNKHIWPFFRQACSN